MSARLALRTSSVSMNCCPSATGMMLPPRMCSGTLSVTPACMHIVRFQFLSEAQPPYSELSYTKHVPAIHQGRQCSCAYMTSQRTAVTSVVQALLRAAAHIKEGIWEVVMALTSNPGPSNT